MNMRGFQGMENSPEKAARQSSAPAEATSKQVTVRPEDTILQPYGLPLGNHPPLVSAERSLTIEGIDYIAIRVANVRRAETFYSGFFQMDVVFRAHRNESDWHELPPDYDWDQGIRDGNYVDLVYLTRPGLSLVLLGAGVAAIFVEPRLSHISLRVSSGSLLTIRAQALVRSFPVSQDEDHSFVFQDPYEITWHIIDR